MLINEWLNDNIFYTILGMSKSSKKKQVYSGDAKLNRFIEQTSQPLFEKAEYVLQQKTLHEASYFKQVFPKHIPRRAILRAIASMDTLDVSDVDSICSIIHKYSKKLDSLFLMPQDSLYSKSDRIQLKGNENPHKVIADAFKELKKTGLGKAFNIFMDESKMKGGTSKSTYDTTEEEDVDDVEDEEDGDILMEKTCSLCLGSIMKGKEPKYKSLIHLAHNEIKPVYDRFAQAPVSVKEDVLRPVRKCPGISNVRAHRYMHKSCMENLIKTQVNSRKKIAQCPMCNEAFSIMGDGYPGNQKKTHILTTNEYREIPELPRGVARMVDEEIRIEGEMARIDPEEMNRINRMDPLERLNQQGNRPANQIAGIDYPHEQIFHRIARRILFNQGNYEEYMAVYFTLWAFCAWMISRDTSPWRGWSYRTNIPGILLFTMFIGLLQMFELLLYEATRRRNHRLYRLNRFGDPHQNPRDVLRDYFTNFHYNWSNPNTPLAFFGPTHLYYGYRSIFQKVKNSLGI
jgi:hypothetical protein